MFACQWAEHRDVYKRQHVGTDMLAVVFWGHDKRENLSVADRIARKVKGDK